MSTLGRKAMTKTLERLKKNSLYRCKRHINTIKDVQRYEEYKSNRNVRTFTVQLIDDSIEAALSLIAYIQALEDYGYELDEEWNKLLETIEQTQKSKEEVKEGKKPSYRV